MGPTQQKPVSKTKNQEFPKIAHEIFANRQIVKKGDEETINIKVAVPHQKEYLSWVERLNKVGQHDALFLPKHHSFNKQGFCGLSGTVDLTYQNYPFLLSDEINNRECLGTKFFEENELWYLVLTLLSAAEFFHSQQRKVGDIRPQNIFISEDGSVKVACIVSWPLEITNYEKSFQKNITYISPEEVNEINFAKIEPSTSLELSETFSIGLTLLDAVTLSDSTDLYKGQKSFDFERLEERTKELKSKEEYSVLLKALIINMCDPSPENRTNARELYEWLNPFEEEINNFENFQTSELPYKLREEIKKSQGNFSPPRHSLPPVQQSMPVNNNGTYINNYISYQQPNVTTFETVPAPIPAPVRVEYQSYIPPAEIRGLPMNMPSTQARDHPINFQTGQVRDPSLNVPPPQQVLINRGPTAPSPGIGFSYQPSGAPSMPSNYVVSSKPMAYPSTTTVPSVSMPMSTSIESTYVPANSSKFSLDKIDQQLQQSRKLFPSS